MSDTPHQTHISHHTDHHTEHEAHGGHGGHHDNGSMANRAMAVSATLHCLTGCAIGEIAGLMIGTAAGLSNGWTIVLSIALAFVFGYTLSTLPLLKAGLGVATALSVVLAADTVSIATMEVADNVVMALIPGAMDAGLVNVTFWVGMAIALTVAGFAAYPVNKYLLAHGKGHALTHEYHGASGPTEGFRAHTPSLATSTLVAAITAFMLGGLVVSIADTMGSDQDSTHNSTSSGTH